MNLVLCACVKALLLAHIHHACPTMHKAQNVWGHQSASQLKLVRCWLLTKQRLPSGLDLLHFVPVIQNHFCCLHKLHCTQCQKARVSWSGACQIYSSRAMGAACKHVYVGLANLRCEVKIAQSDLAQQASKPASSLPGCLVLSNASNSSPPALLSRAVMCACGNPLG